MKNILIISILLLALQAEAAVKVPYSSHLSSCVFKAYIPDEGTTKIDKLKFQLAKAKRLRTGGIIMMSIGAPLALAGLAMIYTSLGLDAAGKTNYNSSAQDPLWDAGLACSLAGMGLVVPGAFLYSTNNKNMRRYKRKLRDIEEDK